MQELFFPPDTQHDSYVEIRKIVRDARHSVRIVDRTWMKHSSICFVMAGDESLKIELLTSKLPHDFMHEVNKFGKQYLITTQAKRNLSSRSGIGGVRSAT